MAFQKHTQSESHEVVKGEEREAIRKHAGNNTAEKLSEIERERMLKEIESLQQK